MFQVLSAFLRQWTARFGDRMSARLMFATVFVALICGLVAGGIGWQEFKAMPPDNGVGPATFGILIPIIYAVVATAIAGLGLPILISLARHAHLRNPESLHFEPEISYLPRR